MSARRQDHLLRYAVDSHTRRNVTHMVELDLYDGHGACTCENFKYRLEPLLKSGVKPDGHQLRCRHIIEARDRLADDIVRQVMENEKKSLRNAGKGGIS